MIEVTPWLRVTSNDFYMHLSSNAITKGSRKTSPGKFPPIKIPPGKLTPSRPRKIPTQKIPTWNIPTHFINCLSSLFLLVHKWAENVHVHPPTREKNSSNQRKLTMSSDRFSSWNLSLVNTEYCWTAIQQVMSCEPTRQQLRVFNFEPMDQQLIKLTVCEAAN